MISEYLNMELILQGKAPLIGGIEEEQAIIGIWADPGGSTPAMISRAKPGSLPGQRTYLRN